MDRHAIYAVALTLACLLPGCDSPQAKLRQKGIEEYNAGQYQMAFDTFNKGLDYNQMKATDNYYAGASAMKLGNLKRAEYHFYLAWQADPSMADVKDALTECLLREGKEDQALDFLERDAALTAKVKDPRPLKQINNRPYTHQVDERMFLTKGGDRLRVADTYERMGDLDNARLNYNKAIELDPTNPQIHFAAGMFCERINNKAAAGTEYTAVYQLDPKYPDIIPALARAGLQPMPR